MPELTEHQISVIKCAYADLVGALQAKQACDSELHDWKAHIVSINEMEEAFPFITPSSVTKLTCDVSCNLLAQFKTEADKIAFCNQCGAYCQDDQAS